MGQAQEKKKYYTVEEYFELEETSEFRHEYYDGEVFATAATTLNHSRIASNIEFRLRGQRKSYCDVFRESVKLEAVKNFYYPYPDILFTCNPFDLKEKHKISFPSLIVEVLSKSTENYDKGFKLKKYKQISSLQYYMLVSQYEMSVELYSRMDDFQWIYTEYDKPEQIIDIDKLEIKLSLSEIYENILFLEEIEEVEKA